MNEYEYTVHDENENNENMNNNYYNGSMNGSDIPPKKPKKHTGAKIIAFLLAMGCVSGGSIYAYKEFGEKNNNTPKVTRTASISEETTEAEKKKIEAEAVSIVKPKDVGGNALTTEEIVEKVLPSVVGIESTFEVTVQNNNSIFDDDFFGFGFGGFGGFGGGNSEPTTREATATGTGVITTSDGYIATNAHVIYDTEYGAGRAKSISVLTDNDTSYDAEVIGYDVDCDLAVLKIKEKNLTAAEFGDSDDLKLGESVVAIGNPLGFELMDTVTSGIVSGLNRKIDINDKSMNLLQTDAAINSGNSGGPLINKYGQVIGINSSKMSASYSQTSIEGIGFAIPSNDVARIIDDIMEYGYVTGKPQLGLSCSSVTETASEMYNIPLGVFVTEVTKGGAAEKAGIIAGDVITKIDGKEVKTTEELNNEKNNHEAGDEIEVTYIRQGEEMTVTVVLDEINNSQN